MPSPKWYDITASMDKIPEETLRAWLDKHCERYAYGRETGENGYKHYQIRLVLKTGADISEMRKIWSAVGHVTCSHTRNFDYVLKEGDFVCSWIKIPESMKNPVFRPWQKALLELEQNDREIDVIIDLKGNTGKSWITKYLCLKNRATNIPCGLEAKDIMRMCLKRQNTGWYILDMPRASTKQAKSTWSAIESIKNGYLWDDRYTWEEKWIDPPKVTVFTNEYPKYDLVSEDRLRFWAPVETGLVSLAK
ncbi:MAG: replication associated protein [Huchismacovirus sp.]|nr:MAG: replication associated protein [Huchismacovirus sp.]UNY48364.1 MAG: replication associated protein [Huchismacovirus sp.]UNY48366.1 MAG: replication associated protein [Huchismacovirus sp.]UNY48368.1 MAG: replication associated protein [Huchismacovirus sp.]